LSGDASWLILADDLTGAADCAVAFAERGMSSSVAWKADAPDDAVLALDAGSRQLAPAMAAARHRTLLDAHRGRSRRFFKKIDSTLRGQPVAELVEALRFRRERGASALCILAPAYPAAGRTTEDGRIRLAGQALEQTPLWALDHSYPSADLVAVLKATGLNVRLATLADVRGGGSLARLVGDAVATGVDAVVCDATTQEDLDLVAQATLPIAEVFWTGSGGLALALAQALQRPALPPPAFAWDAPRTGGVRTGGGRGGGGRGGGGILFVVGSVAEASRAASALLAVDETLLVVAVAPATLRRGPQDAGWQASARRVAATLECGGDVLVEIGLDPDPDLSQGAELAARLAALLQPSAPAVGALFVTGGETALVLLDAFGATGFRLVEQIEPGVPLGLTRGSLHIPVVTKAGAFGDAGTLRRCLSHLRRLRQTEILE
jgi:uncharacterized protein YgbK (DUF1537 family)